MLSLMVEKESFNVMNYAFSFSLPIDKLKRVAGWNERMKGKRRKVHFKKKKNSTLLATPLGLRNYTTTELSGLSTVSCSRKNQQQQQQQYYYY